MMLKKEYLISLFLGLGLTATLVLILFYVTDPSVYLISNILGYHIIIFLLLATSLLISKIAKFNFNKTDTPGFTVSAFFIFIFFMLLVYLVSIYFNYGMSFGYFINALLGSIISAVYLGALFYIVLWVRDIIIIRRNPKKKTRSKPKRKKRKKLK
jgi:phosphatidylserine synthase